MSVSFSWGSHWLRNNNVVNINRFDTLTRGIELKTANINILNRCKFIIRVYKSLNVYNIWNSSIVIREYNCRED